MPPSLSKYPRSAIGCVDTSKIFMIFIPPPSSSDFLSFFFCIIKMFLLLLLHGFYRPLRLIAATTYCCLYPSLSLANSSTFLTFGSSLSLLVLYPPIHLCPGRPLCLLVSGLRLEKRLSYQIVIFSNLFDKLGKRFHNC